MNIINIHTIHQGHELLGLTKPKHPLISIVDNKEIRFPENFTNASYVFDFYIITLKNNIKGSFKYGRNQYDYESGTMLFIAPGQTIKSNLALLDDNQPSGFTIVFHSELLRRHRLNESIEKYNYFSYDTTEGLHLSEPEQQTVSDIVKKTEKEIGQNYDAHTQNLIVSNLELLLEYCNRYYQRQFYVRTNTNKDVVSQFYRNLKIYFENPELINQGIPSVKYFGEKLNLSSGYLSDLLKTETGKSTLEHIHERIIEKAKQNLLGTTLSVSEIAYNLGFDYPQHFSKLFKSKCGQSPTKFRHLN